MAAKNKVGYCTQATTFNNQPSIQLSVLVSSLMMSCTVLHLCTLHCLHRAPLVLHRVPQVQTLSLSVPNAILSRDHWCVDGMHDVSFDGAVRNDR